MKNLRSSNAANQAVQLRKGNLCAIFSLILFFGIQFSPLQKAYSQVVWTDFGDYQLGYELSSSQSFFFNGDQFDIKLYADVPAAAQAIGVRFDLDLDAEVSVDASAPLSTPGSSWLGNSDDLTTVHQQVSGEERGSVYRTDEPERSGNGWVLSMHVTVGTNGVPASQVVDNLGGVVILAENMDMRTAPVAAGEQGEGSGGQQSDLEPETSSPLFASELVNEVSVYPNPCTDWVQFHLEGNDTQTATVYTMDRQVALQQNVYSGQKVNLGHLQAGIYLVILSSSDGSASRPIRLVKQ